MISVATGLGFQYMTPLNKIPQEYGKWFNVNDVLAYFTIFFWNVYWAMRFVAINEKKSPKARTHMRIAAFINSLNRNLFGESENSKKLSWFEG